MSKAYLVPLSKSGLRHLIEYSYEGDTDLIDKYQAGNRTFEECVEYNYNELVGYLTDPNFKGEIFFWQIRTDSDHVVGYCVTIENDEKPHMLLSCAINKKYRTKEILTAWLEAVEEKLGVPYYIGLWEKNTRAIEFFLKNGFDAFESRDENYKYLVKKPELLNIEKLMASWQ